MVFPLAGCTAHTQFRRDFSTGALHDGPTAEVVNPADVPAGRKLDRVLENYGDTLKLAHIECDDQGGFWEAAMDAPGSAASGMKPGRNQLDFLEATVEDDMRARPEKYRNGAIILVFAHGWNNNAREGNGNLTEFRQVLHTVWSDEQKKLRRPVIGVYLSWRGRVLRNSTDLGVGGVPVAGFLADVPHYLSFWNRKATAEKLGYRATAEALKRLSLLRKRIEEKEPRPRSEANSRLIVIGHSFGAAAVFSAVSRFYEDELIELASDPERRASEPWIHRHWDLVVLVNPAFEALRYTTIARYSRDLRIIDLARRGTQPYLVLPRLVVVGAQNDVPNMTIFPIGQRLGNATSSVQHTQRLDQGKRLVTSLGSYRDFATHELAPNPSGTGPWLTEIRHEPDGRGTIANFPVVRAGDRAFATPFQDAGVAEDFRSIGPFIVASASPAVVDGHNGIWKREFSGFLTRLIMAREEAVRKAKMSRGR